MPLTLQEFKSVRPDELMEKYSYQELNLFMDQLDQQMGVSRGEPQREPAKPPSGEPQETRDWITAYDPSEDLFSLKNLGTMAGNIPGSAAYMVGDIAEAVTSPIETGKALLETGGGNLLKAIGERFGVTYDEEEGLGYDPELLKKTIVEDPTGLLLDVAPGGQALGAGAKAARLGTKAISAAQRMGPRAGRVAEAAVRAADSPLVRAATSPVKAMAQTVRGAGKGTGLLTRTLASVMSGIKPGVLTAGREALGQTGEAGKAARRGFEAPKEGFEVPKEGAPRRGFETTREGFEAGKPENAIPDAINEIEKTISKNLDDVGKGIRDSILGDQMVSPDAYNAFLINLEKTFGEFGVKPGHKAGKLDFGKSRIPKDVGAQGRIEDALDLIRQARDGYRNVYTGQKTSKGSTLDDYWTARTQISEANSTAFKQKYGDMEQGLLKGLYGNLNELMDSVGNTEFQALNRSYKEGIELRDRFSKMAGSQMAPEQQISSIIDAVRKGEGTSDLFLRGIEETTKVPLRAIAAGQDLVGLIPRELVGKSAFMAILPAVAAGVVPAKTMLAMFLAPPMFLRRYLKMIGASERAIKELGTFADNLVGLPRVAAMAEQGLTIGGIINQLSEQAEQPSFLGRLAPASAGSMRTGVAEQPSFLGQLAPASSFNEKQTGLQLSIDTGVPLADMPENLFPMGKQPPDPSGYNQPSPPPWMEEGFKTVQAMRENPSLFQNILGELAPGSADELALGLMPIPGFKHLGKLLPKAATGKLLDKGAQHAARLPAAKKVTSESVQTAQEVLDKVTAQTLNPSKFELPSAVETAIGQFDQLGFDTPRQAAAAILQHGDWLERWDVSDMAPAVQKMIQIWRKEILATRPDLAAKVLVP